MKLNINDERFLAAVDREGDHEIGAGTSPMTTDRITIPPEAMDKAAIELYVAESGVLPSTARAQWHNGLVPVWTKEGYRNMARLSLQAALTAWPGRAEVDHWHKGETALYLYLPLPQEKNT